jgi:ATP-dependent RNA helicase RhlB
MFDMGFYPDLRKLIKMVPPANRRQTMLFSATLNAWVKNLAWEYTSSPFEIEIKPEIVTVEEIDQVLYHVPSEEKMRLLLGILQREKPDSAIIFCNTKRYTEIIAKRLKINGYDCEIIIGDLPQSRRLKVIEDVKAGKTKLLVATDVAARGLDIEALSMVVNYDLPNEAENYVHRIGRTARAGKTGRAITLASEQDVYELPAIERYIGKKIPSEIAVAELHAEDKSAGQQIRTEISGDRREERRPPRSPAKPPHGAKTRRGGSGGESRGRHPHSHAPADQGHSHGDGRGGKRHEDHRGDGRGGRKGEGERQGRRQETEATGGSRRGGQNTDLSRMSFEERMELYKRKYNSEAPGKNRSDGKSTGKPKEAASGKTAPEKAAPKKTAPKKAAQQPQEQAAPKAAPQEKKGVLSRLLGVFRKK